MNVVRMRIRATADYESLESLFGGPDEKPPSVLREPFNMLVQEASPYLAAGPIVDDELKQVLADDPATGTKRPMMMVVTAGTLESWQALDSILVREVDETGALVMRFKLVAQQEKLWADTARGAKAWLS